MAGNFGFEPKEASVLLGARFALRDYGADRKRPTDPLTRRETTSPQSSISEQLRGETALV